MEESKTKCPKHQHIELQIPETNKASFNRQQLKAVCSAMMCKGDNSQKIASSVFNAVTEVVRSSEIKSYSDALGNVINLTITQELFNNIAQKTLADAKYESSEHFEDFSTACQLISNEQSLVVLLGGTSGTGKSTLSSLLASRLGIATALSSDSIRHIMRNFMEKDENPILFASTYETGHLIQEEGMSEKQAAVVGHGLQCDLVYDYLETVILDHINRKQSIVIEGVHLSVEVMKRLMKKFPEVISFVVVIKKENKHKERFAVRSKYMTLDPKFNKYIDSFRYIRAIQKSFIKKAGMPLIPVVDNGNLDRALGLIHATIVKSLRQKNLGKKPFFDLKRKQSSSVYQEYNYLSKNIWSSKKVHKLIKSKADKNELFNRFFRPDQDIPTIPEEQASPEQCTLDHDVGSDHVSVDTSEFDQESAADVGSLVSGSVDIDISKAHSGIWRRNTGMQSSVRSNASGQSDVDSIPEEKSDDEADETSGEEDNSFHSDGSETTVQDQEIQPDAGRKMSEKEDDQDHKVTRKASF